MDFDPVQIIVMILAAFLGSTVLSAIGFGIGMVAMPILLLVLEQQTAVIVLNTVSVPVTLLVAMRTRKHASMRQTLPIAVAGVMGALTGAFVLSIADTQILRVSTVVLIILLTALTATSLNFRIPLEWLVGPIIGFVVGIMLGALAIGGPLLVVFVLAIGWQRHAVRASLSMYLLFIMVAATVGYVVNKEYTTERLILVAIAIWPILIGFWIGDRIAGRLNEVLFRRAAIGVIIVTSLIVLAREILRI